MDCGPTAVARLTKQSFECVLAHFRFIREQNGRRKRRSGTYVSECKYALGRAGYDISDEQQNRRVRLRDWAKGQHGGRWFMVQRNHFFALCGAREIRLQASLAPDAVITGWFRVARATGSDDLMVAIGMADRSR